MSKLTRILTLWFLYALAASAAQEENQKYFPKNVPISTRDAVLWSNPADIGSRNLYYGPGGEEDAPSTTKFTYDKEDLNGTSPKFDIRDQNGVKWRVKLGEEARPETVATRLLWAVGYFANEDYFLPTIHVEGMQPVSRKRRKRVRGLIDADGTMHNVRLKRYSKNEKKVGTWQWHLNPFTGTRELNGLRVMMALINNWDLKDENNAIYAEKELRGDWQNKDGLDASETVYMVSDVGASFGTTGRVRNRAVAKGNVNSYRNSKFIRRVTPDYVDFYVPAREALVFAVNPKEFIARLHLRWIGRRVPRTEARWMGQLLAQLSRDQIHDAFRAAGYSPEEVDVFRDILEKRITELNDL